MIAMFDIEQYRSGFNARALAIAALDAAKLNAATGPMLHFRIDAQVRVVEPFQQTLAKARPS